jgi:hypothetical protein
VYMATVLCVIKLNILVISNAIKFNVKYLVP